MAKVNVASELVFKLNLELNQAEFNYLRLLVQNPISECETPEIKQLRHAIFNCRAVKE